MRSHLLLSLCEVLLGQAEVLLGLGHFLTLGLNRLGHVVVIHHGQDPLEQAGSGRGHRLEAVVIEARILRTRHARGSAKGMLHPCVRG